MNKITAKRIYDKLMEKGEPKSELEFTNHYELLVASMLSPQTPDKLTNKVTPEVFKKYKNLKELAEADLEELLAVIKPINFNKTKAKNLIEAAKTIVNYFGGKIPSNIPELTTMNGIGRKVAQVIMIEGFNVPAMPVDTHVFRTAGRLGLTNSKNAEGCETDLRILYDESLWNNLHRAMVLHGRYVCTAPKPKCDECTLKELCNYYKNEVHLDK